MCHTHLFYYLYDIMTYLKRLKSTKCLAKKIKSQGRDVLVYVNLNQFDIDKYQDGEKCVEMVESGRFKSS